jgi:hypothetical protein
VAAAAVATTALAALVVADLADLLTIDATEPMDLVAAAVAD